MMSFLLPLLRTLAIVAVAEAFGAPIAVGVSSTLAVLAYLEFDALRSELRNMDAGIENVLKNE